MFGNRRRERGGEPPCVPDRRADLEAVADAVRDHAAVADAFVAKSFTDRHVVVDLERDGKVPEAVIERLAAADCRPADAVYDEAACRGFAGASGDATRRHFVDVRTRGEHRSYVVE